MPWCEHCRDHFDREHYDGDAHKPGPSYGPTGQAIVHERLLDLLAGPGAAIWPDDDRPGTFEVRRDGKHVGFLLVTEDGARWA